MDKSLARRIVESAAKLPEATYGLRSKIVASFVGFPEAGKRRPPAPEIRVDLLLRGPNSVDTYPEKEVIPTRLSHKQLAKLLPSNSKTSGWKVVHASGDPKIEEFGEYMWRRHVVVIGRNDAGENQ